MIWSLLVVALLFGCLGYASGRSATHTHHINTIAHKSFLIRRWRSRYYTVLMRMYRLEGRKVPYELILAAANGGESSIWDDDV